MSAHNGTAIIFTMRQAEANLVIVADKQSVNTELAALPYIDSMRRSDLAVDGWHSATAPGLLSVAVDRTSDYFLLGTQFDQLAELTDQITVTPSQLWVGAVSTAYVTPTNPYVRDSNGKAVLSGRLTLNQVKPSVTKTSGLVASVTTVNGDITTTDFGGRVLGLSSNLIARQPSPTTQLTVGVGREVRECSYTFTSKDWLPMTVTAIEWTGQYFNRVRRAG